MKFCAMMFLSLSAGIASFAGAQSVPPASGLLITQVNSQQWRIRMTSATSISRFSGVLESDMPITGVQSFQLENGDSAKLATANSLGATFAVWPGGTDGVDFTLSAGAKLCLRDTGSSGVPIYLGATLQDAIPVTAPVALASADACTGTTGGPPPPGPRKFHVGHWIVMDRGAESQALMQDAIRPGVVGIVKRYTWLSLEPTQGAYQFSTIASDLAWAAANGMRLIVMIEDKTFVLERPDPPYLDAYTPRNVAGGYTMARWSPTVVTRFNALIKALGAQFDKNNNFEGIATQETALQLDSQTLNAFGYTPEKYRDSYINTLTASTVSLPTSRVFWFMNFLVGNQAYIGSIASAVASTGVVMGGPDVRPDDQALQSRTYPFYTQFYGKMPLVGQVENSCYSEPHMTSGYQTKDWTMPELFAYARNNMHVNYMFWVRITKSSLPGAYTWADALPVIAAHPTF